MSKPNRSYVVVGSILGAFVLYGVLSACNNFAPNANGQQSGCCAAPALTKVLESDVWGETAPISVGSYREVAVGVDNDCVSAVLFRADAGSPFLFVGQTLGKGGRLRVDGADMILRSTCNVHFVVTGVP